MYVLYIYSVSTSVQHTHGYNYQPPVVWVWVWIHHGHTLTHTHRYPYPWPMWVCCTHADAYLPLQATLLGGPLYFSQAPSSDYLLLSSHQPTSSNCMPPPSCQSTTFQVDHMLISFNCGLPPTCHPSPSSNHPLLLHSGIWSLLQKSPGWMKAVN